MQALILAGGEGTRLRPLTSTVPKPVVPLVDRPFIAFMLDWLRTHGVEDIVISCGHMASGVRNVLGDGSAFGVQLRYVEEPTPLGTGGALKYAESLLDDRFFMLNGDVLTDLDLSAQLAQHERTGATATLALTPVEDPTNYGLVRTDGDGAVTEFVEKPSYDQIDTRNISAGAYVLERSVLDLLEADQPASIERDVFPQLVGSGLYGCVSENYWLDIGTPERYLEATWDILEGTVGTAFAERAGDGYLVVEQSVESEGRIIPSALVESGCRIADGARVGGRVVLESGVMVGPQHRDRALGGHARRRDRRQLHAQRLHRRRRRADRRQHAHHRALRARRGRDDRRRQRARQRRRLFPGVELPDGAIRFCWRLDHRHASSSDRAMQPACSGPASSPGGAGGRSARRNGPGRHTDGALDSAAVAEVDTTGQTADILGAAGSPGGRAVARRGGVAPARGHRGRADRRRHGRVGRRRRARARRAVARLARPLELVARRRSAGVDRAGHARAVLELLGQHGGDAGRLRRRRRGRRAARRELERRRAARPRPPRQGAGDPAARRLPAPRGGRLLVRGRAGGGGRRGLRAVAAARDRGDRAVRALAGRGVGARRRRGRRGQAARPRAPRDRAGDRRAGARPRRRPTAGSASSTRTPSSRRSPPSCPRPATTRSSGGPTRTTSRASPPSSSRTPAPASGCGRGSS